MNNNKKLKYQSKLQKEKAYNKIKIQSKKAQLYHNKDKNNMTNLREDLLLIKVH